MWGDASECSAASRAKANSDAFRCIGGIGWGVDERWRGDDAVRGGLRGLLPGLPHGPALARLLALPLPQHDGTLAELQEPPDLGRVRGLDLRNGLRDVLVRGPHPRPRHPA